MQAKFKSYEVWPAEIWYRLPIMLTDLPILVVFIHTTVNQLHECKLSDRLDKDGKSKESRSSIKQANHGVA